MGNKRIGFKRIAGRLSQLQRELQLNQSTLVGAKKRVKSLDAGTGHALTADDSGCIVLFAAAGATTVTLPTPEEGLHYTFVTQVQSTADHIIKTLVASQGLLGGLILNAQTANKDDVFAAASDGSDDTITMDGNTKGGAPGSRIECVGINSTTWAVTGVVLSDGSSVATPFSDGS
tara:strand:+ start:2537 stop:3061 length:525 start_codon:yes stop_codon:yes gene_type:complete